MKKEMRWECNQSFVFGDMEAKDLEDSERICLISLFSLFLFLFSSVLIIDEVEEEEEEEEEE